MTGLLAQGAAADPGVGGGTLAAYIALAVSVLGPLVAVINAWSQRRTRQERLGSVRKNLAEGEVIASGSPLEWRQTDHQALLDERSFSKELRERADAAEGRVRELSDQLAETRRERDNDRELLDDLRREFDQLVARIASCEAGHFCPVADALTRDPRGGDPL